MAGQKMKIADLPNSPMYILCQWPRGLRILEAIPFRRGYSGADLLCLCHWAGMSSPNKLRQSGFAYASVVSLAEQAAQDRHSANYHHSGHVAHVVMAVGVLAAADNLSQSDTDMLIVAALVHDLDHQGLLRDRALYEAELRSANLAKSQLSKYHSDSRVVQRLEDLILATSFSDDSIKDHILATDRLAAYLVDADLFASTFYARHISLALTGHIKAEDRLKEDRQVLASGFANNAQQRGFHTAVATDLHAALPYGYSVLSLRDF